MSLAALFWKMAPNVPTMGIVHFYLAIIDSTKLKYFLQGKNKNIHFLRVQRALCLGGGFLYMAKNKVIDIKEKKRKLAPKYNTTDLGNAQRLVKHHGQNIRYCHAFKKWYIWTDKRWLIDPNGTIIRLAKDTVRVIYSEAAASLMDDERKNLAKHAIRSESEARIKAMISLTESELGIPILPEQLDANPWLLNCQNGTIDLRTGQLQQHQHENYITKIIPVEFDPKATCPTWIRFLNDIMAGNQDLIEFLQKAVGYSLTGSTQEQVMFIMHGSGQNGKSTFIDTINALMSEYAKQTPTDALMIKKNNGIPNDIARLKEARFVSAVETEEGHRLAEVLVKQLTGGDTITARFLHQEFFEFKPQFKIWLATNHKPVIRGTDYAIWRRIKLIPFTVTIPPEKKDKHLVTKLIDELPGIFQWAISGCLEWQKNGLQEPKEVIAATENYRAEMDVISDFLDERCVIKPYAKAKVSDIYKAYIEWCEINGEKSLSRRAFNNRLKERGFTNKQGTGGYYYWEGLGIKE